MRTITAISTLSVATTAALIFVSAPVRTASAAERSTARTSATTVVVSTEYGTDGARAGNIEFEWKVEEGES